MPEKNNQNQLAYLLGLILVLIFVVVFIWLFGTRLTLGFTDNAYHLAVAEGFSRAGGITTWDFWNSLPFGRPQNYPPLFHLILADLLKIGFSTEVALKLMMEIFVVGGLALFAFGISKIYNWRVAFWSVLILSVSVRFICASVTIMPSSMVLFLSPLLFHLFMSKKWVSYIVLLILMLYLHLFVPLIILFSLALYSLLFERKMFLTGLKASLIALALYSPWIIHIFLNGIKNIKYFDLTYPILRYQTAPLINIIFVSLFIVSLIFLIAKKKLIKVDYFFIILLGFFLVMAFLATERTLSGHLWVFIALFTALFFDRFLGKIATLPYLIFIIFTFALYLMPGLIYDRGFYIDFSQVTFTKIILGDAYSATSLEEESQKIFSDIKNNSKSGESIGTALSYFKGNTLDKGEYQSSVSMFLASNANRPTINLYQPEYFYRPLPNLSKARLVLLNERATNLTPQYFTDFGYSSQGAIELTKTIKENFLLTSTYESNLWRFTENMDIEADLSKDVYLYKKNEGSVIKETIPKFVFPFWLANSILVLFIGLLLFDNKKLK